MKQEKIMKEIMKIKNIEKVWKSDEIIKNVEFGVKIIIYM